MKKREILQMVKDQGTRYIRLVDPRGNQIIPINTAKFKIETRAEQIERVLNSELTEPGLYYIELLTSQKGVPIRVPFQKGGGMHQAPVILQDNGKNDLILQQLSDLTAKLSDIENRLNEPDENLDHDESLDDDEAPEDKYNWLGNAITGLLPLADRFIDIYEKKSLNDNKQAPVQQVAPDIAPAIFESLKFMDENNQITLMEALKKSNPEVFNRVCNLINQTNGQV